MEKDRKTKIIAIVALFIGVAALSLGFATFSARLIIKSKATVTPDADSFKVLLSRIQTSVLDGTVKPTGNGEDATINNTDDPTISNLKANFVSPGEKVVYEFYAVNAGELDAYLNKIEFGNVSGKDVNKVCTAGEDTTDTYVQNACNSIRVTVKVAADDKACQTSKYHGHTLAKGVGEKVVVTIEYNKGGARADGPFTVEFGDIKLNYSTVDPETKEVPACGDFVSNPVVNLDVNDKTNITDGNNDGKINVGDKVTLGTESFFVLSTDEAAGTVTMLAEWNLNVGTRSIAEGTAGIQNESCKGKFGEENLGNCTVAFSSGKYWSTPEMAYPAEVYGEANDVVRPYVEEYVNKLQVDGYSSVTGRLITYDELIGLGCTETGGTGNCNGAPGWFKNTTFWSGTAKNSGALWVANTAGIFNGISYMNKDQYGIRPVITINVAEI